MKQQTWSHRLGAIFDNCEHPASYCSWIMQNWAVKGPVTLKSLHQFINTITDNLIHSVATSAGSHEATQTITQFNVYTILVYITRLQTTTSN